MTNEAKIIAFAVVAVGIAAAAIRRVAEKRGVQLTMYVVSLVFGAAAGAWIAAAAVPALTAIGLVAGVAAVELGGAFSSAVRDWLKARRGK